MPVTVNVKRDDRLVGFVDLAVSPSKYPSRVYFEIKTSIRPGSDIRQINAYKHYLSGLADDTEGKAAYSLLFPQMTGTQICWLNKESNL